MQITQETLLQIIGQKEIELYAYKSKIEQLQQENTKLKQEAADADVSDKEGR